MHHVKCLYKRNNFSFTNIFAELPSPDEVEAYVVLQECLEMRKRYVFKEVIAPWEKEVISDPSTPKPNPAPFYFTSEGKSDVSSYLCCSYFVPLQLITYSSLMIINMFYNFCSTISKCKMVLFMSIQIKTVRYFNAITCCL